jgi:hypothetical protein
MKRRANQGIPAHIPSAASCTCRTWKHRRPWVDHASPMVVAEGPLPHCAADLRAQEVRKDRDTPKEGDARKHAFLRRSHEVMVRAPSDTILSTLDGCWSPVASHMSASQKYHDGTGGCPECVLSL